MTIMNKLATLNLTIFACVILLCAGPAIADDTQDLTMMLQDFLANSGKKAAHQSFWADDLVYTSSAGLRFGKADILAGFEDADDTATADDEPVMEYFGDEIDIRLYGDTAIVAFKLVGTPTDTSVDTGVLYYFNTGTFLKHDGVWQVIAWQATKIPPL